MQDSQPITQVDISHHIQRGVLMALRQKGATSYSDLKPDGIEGNAFNYHLRLLKQAKLIEYKSRKYSLSSTGQLVADAFSLSSARLVFRPHHFTYVLVTSGSKVLIYRPSRQPAVNRPCLLSGKLHYGDSMKESIEREMQRRNLTNHYTVEFLCSINIRYYHNDDIVMHRPGVVWHVMYDGPLEESNTQSGSSFWVERTKIATDTSSLPDITLSLERLRAHDHSSIDLDCAL